MSLFLLPILQAALTQDYTEKTRILGKGLNEGANFLGDINIAQMNEIIGRVLKNMDVPFQDISDLILLQDTVDKGEQSGEFKSSLQILKKGPKTDEFQFPYLMKCFAFIMEKIHDRSKEQARQERVKAIFADKNTEIIKSLKELYSSISSDHESEISQLSEDEKVMLKNALVRSYKEYQHKNMLKLFIASYDKSLRKRILPCIRICIEGFGNEVSSKFAKKFGTSGKITDKVCEQMLGCILQSLYSDSITIVHGAMTEAHEKLSKAKERITIRMENILSNESSQTPLLPMDFAFNGLNASG